MLKKLHNLLTEGHEFFEQGNYEQAILIFTEAIECAPNVAAIYYFRASAYHSQKKYHEAQIDYATSLDIEFNDDVADLLEEVESKLREVGEDDAKVWEVTKAMAIAPYNAQLYADRARLYCEKACYWRAEKDAAKAIELAPNSAEAHYIYASALHGMAIYCEDDPDCELYSDDDSHDYLSKDSFDLRIREINTAIELKPNYIDAYIARADFYLSRINPDDCEEGEDCEQYYADALANYGAAIKLDPERAQSYADRANCYRQHNDDDLALEDLNKAIELDPNDARQYQIRGYIFYVKEDYDKAIADFTEAINQGDHYFTYLLRADAYERQGKYELALADITQMINKYKAMPNHVSTLYQGRGEIYLKMEKYNLAIADFTKAVKLDPSNEDAKDLLEKTKKRR